MILTLFYNTQMHLHTWKENDSFTVDMFKSSKLMDQKRVGLTQVNKVFVWWGGLYLTPPCPAVAKLPENVLGSTKAYMWVAMNCGRSYRIMTPWQQETLMQPWHCNCVTQLFDFSLFSSSPNVSYTHHAFIIHLNN